MVVNYSNGASVRIELELCRDLPVQLPAAAKLRAIKDQVQALPDEGLRHPLGIYNVSVQTVVAAASHLLDELEKTFPLVGEEAADRVLRAEGLRQATRQFLLANAEHVDACEKILKCYFASKGDAEYAKAKRELRSNLAWYGRHVMTQANHLKHRQAQVRSLSLYTDQLAAPGYFVESQIAPDVVGPDPIVHDGKNAGFSYSRQLRVFICGLFYVSRTLSVFLSGRKPDEVSSNSETPGLGGLIERIASFPDFMFPDEYGQPYAGVHSSKNNFVISYGLKKSVAPPYSRAQFKMGLGGDGVTRSFQVPYLRG